MSSPTPGTPTLFDMGASTDDDVTAGVGWSIMAEVSDETAVTLRSAVGDVQAFNFASGDANVSELGAILAECGHPRSHAALRQSLGRWRDRLSATTVASVRTICDRDGIGILTPAHQHWPDGLARLGPLAPPVLYVRGRASALVADVPRAGLVGARGPSNYGSELAFEWGHGLAERGAISVSGAALGIDGQVHRGSLAAASCTVDAPKTIAVLACGVDLDYPRQHTRLLGQIAANGALVSEYPPDVKAAKHRFLHRNRLIAGMCDAVVVIEARSRSGALSTANWAASHGIALGAVPGSVHSALSMGPHRVLREFDGVAVTCLDDVIELAGGIDAGDDDIPAHLGERERRILGVLQEHGDMSEGHISRVATLSIADVRAGVGHLGLAGYISATICPDGLPGWRTTTQRAGDRSRQS